MNNKKAAAKAYPDMRNLTIDAFGTTAQINRFDVHTDERGNIQQMFACIEVFSRTVCAKGRNVLETVEALRYNLENEYSVSARRVGYTPSARAMAEMC